MLLRPLKTEDSLFLFEWRNAKAVSQFMYQDEPITWDSHQDWFEIVMEDTSTSRYRIVERRSFPVGLVSLTNIDIRHKSCEWGGYIGLQDQRGLGLGKAMLQLSLDMAFVELNLNRVTVEVLSTNSSAIKLYESAGFIHEGVLRERAIHEAGPQDAAVLSMLRKEWFPISIDELLGNP